MSVYNHYNVFSISDVICSSSKGNLDSNGIRKSPKGFLLNNTSDYSKPRKRDTVAPVHPARTTAILVFLIRLKNLCATRPYSVGGLQVIFYTSHK